MKSHTFSDRLPQIFRDRQNIQCPRKENSSQRKASQAKMRCSHCCSTFNSKQLSLANLLLGGKTYGNKWWKCCARNEVCHFKLIWITSHACFRYADSGEVAAIIKHRVEDGKMSVTLECGDIVCNSTYVKI